MISEQTELIRSLRLVIDEKTSHEKALQEQVDYLTKSKRLISDRWLTPGPLRRE